MIVNVSIEAVQDLERRIEALEQWKSDTIARELRRAARRAQPPDVYDEMPEDPYERED